VTLGRVVTVVALAAALVAAAVTPDHAGEEVCGIPDWATALTVVLGVAAIAGTALILRERAPRGSPRRCSWPPRSASSAWWRSSPSASSR